MRTSVKLVLDAKTSEREDLVAKPLNLFVLSYR